MNLIRNMLKDLGVTQVVTAKNGFEAFEFMGIFGEDGEIDVVLCDWNMPRMSGVDLLRQIRTCDPDLPFLMITGLSDYDSVSQGQFIGRHRLHKKTVLAG